ncbi:CCR4-NOT transcription complex subunit 9 [Pancytospora epiphaga]|nr:CCR4-NOT transcription complex subunit 9 [Pancytospora epiphaga]
MEKLLDDAFLEAMVSKDKMPPLESILRLMEEDSALGAHLSSKSEFLLVILQVITESFYILNTKNFGEVENYNIRVCMDILRILVKNSEFREFFLEGQMDYYIYPFLLAATDESLRVSTLLFFCALLHDGIPISMRGSELLPLLLKIVDFGSEESQYLSLEALNLILQGNGLDYAVQTLDRFQAIDVVLGALVSKCIFSETTRLLKSLFKIYIRLCDKPNVRQKLKEKLPEGIDSKEAQSLCEYDDELDRLRRRFIQLTK